MGSPRCTKDLVEEALFERGRHLFSELGLVFFDTTSISFEGRGRESIAQYGHSKDHRPDFRQMIVGIALDLDGRPLCCEHHGSRSPRKGQAQTIRGHVFCSFLALCPKWV